MHMLGFSDMIIRPADGAEHPLRGATPEETVKALSRAKAEEVAALFEKYGVSKFIMDSFELFHIESGQNMIAAVDDFIERKKSAAKI